MKSYNGFDMVRAERTYFGRHDGMHLRCLVEVFERDGVDVTREVGSVPDAGELWIVDEDGLAEITADGWDFESRETAGFTRDELADQAAAATL